MSNIFLSKFLSEKYGRKIFICDETKNPTGSHKDHSFGVWLEKIKEEGNIKDSVISSSGNAAASAAYFARQFGLLLHIFVSEKISKEKLEKIRFFADGGVGNILPFRRGGLRQQSEGGVVIGNNNHPGSPPAGGFATPPSKGGDSDIEIKLVARPKFEAAKAVKENDWLLLRSSINDDALLGYEFLAKELDVINPKTIFIPSSSGTLAAGLAKFLKSKPAFHLVQTTKVNTLVKNFDQDFVPEEKSLADAIVDLIGQRRPQAEEIITSSGGFGWVINNKEIESARAELKEAGIECSYTSALGLAGMKKAVEKNFEVREPIVIIVT
ncbi:MAG: PLP-dependent lyase/thiolase [Patescibacteria group bacterium]|nr:PLP-dependent lyase/thiolase [Patescibacteria group bacterium]